MLYPANSGVSIRAPTQKELSPARTIVNIKEVTPSPYDVQRPFASDVKNGKFLQDDRDKFKPNNNPAIGQYDVLRADDQTKPKVKGGPYISYADDYEQRNYMDAAEYAKLLEMQQADQKY